LTGLPWTPNKLIRNFQKKNNANPLLHTDNLFILVTLMKLGSQLHQLKLEFGSVSHRVLQPLAELLKLVFVGISLTSKRTSKALRPQQVRRKD
jgi:hypothetical protein